ncbi:MAG: bifunctional ADP-dependent NAD(P)H-hydrate dehydratase/NAD(P)H-hydrate epimerase, partial [Candidatus Omnitrophica bacterium]|nr:bifunctional ADP-dependent NAD(P)H-hydrate dehydratase/NAD(P)H-hydrate epimerase [Candidatus Omnitrophota bacterium]
MIQPGLLPRRSPDAHKGDAGRVFLVAGSRGLSGAAALCTMGALRVGAGLVTLGLPKSLHDPMVEKLTEAMFR